MPKFPLSDQETYLEVFHYPSAPPVNAMRNLAETLLRRREVDNARIGKDVWVTIGYLQNLLLGDPDAVTGQTVCKLQADFEVLALENTPALDYREAAELLLYAADTQQVNSVLGSVGSVLSKRLAAILLPILISWLKSYLLEDGGLEKLIDQIGSFVGNGDSSTVSNPVTPPTGSTGGGELGPIRRRLGGIFQR